MGKTQKAQLATPTAPVAKAKVATPATPIQETVQPLPLTLPTSELIKKLNPNIAIKHPSRLCVEVESIKPDGKSDSYLKCFSRQKTSYGSTTVGIPSGEKSVNPNVIIGNDGASCIDVKFVDSKGNKTGSYSECFDGDGSLGSFIDIKEGANFATFDDYGNGTARKRQ